VLGALAACLKGSFPRYVVLWDIYAGTGRVFPASCIFSSEFPFTLRHSHHAQLSRPADSHIEKYRISISPELEY